MMYGKKILLRILFISDDPLYKINYFINIILENSEKLYSSDYLTIDESMIKYDGKN